MKKVKKVAAILLVLQGMIILHLHADLPDPPYPPDPGGSPVGNGDPVGAPVDGGMISLLILGAGYGARKLKITNLKFSK